MLDTTRHNSVEQVFTCARRATPRDALRMACEAVTGTPGYLVCGSYVVHSNDIDMVHAALPETPVVVAEDLNEAALRPFDLRLSRVYSAGATVLPSSVGAVGVALRLGLLAQMMDCAFAHLENRESFGQKLIHQPLVKGQFSASGALLTRLRAEMAVDMADPLQVEAAQAEIDQHTIQVAKLMGGHGFLRGSLNNLEYLSSLLRATMMQRPMHEA